MTEHHLSYDELAELDEELLSPDRAEAAREHLAGCEQCRERMDAVVATRNTLESLPPVPMPAEVVARLNQALADEAAAGPAPSPSSTVVPNVVDLPSRRRWLGQPTLAASAVAAVLVLLVGAVIVGHHKSPKHVIAAVSAGGVGSGTAGNALITTNPTDSFTTTSSGTDYTATNLDTLVPHLLAPSVASPGPAALSTPQSFGPDTTPVPGTSSGLESSPTTGSSPASGDVHKSTPGSTTGTSTSAHRPIPKALRAIAGSRNRLLDCAATVATTPSAVPLAVDFARWTGGAYRNAPSIIMVFSSPDPGKVVVFVLAPSCNGGALFRTVKVVPISP